MIAVIGRTQGMCWEIAAMECRINQVMIFRKHQVDFLIESIH